MRHWKRILLAFLAVLFISSIFTACNTVRGMGRDVQTMGEGIQRSTN